MSEPKICAACGHEGTRVEFYKCSCGGSICGGCKEDGGRDLCALCAATSCGNQTCYPTQYLRDGRIMATVCYVGNVILDALENP